MSTVKPKKSDKKPPRPSPTASATLFAPGTRRKGNDGRMYEVAVTKTGVQRWVACSSTSKATKKPVKAKTAAAPVHDDVHEDSNDLQGLAHRVVAKKMNAQERAFVSFVDEWCQELTQKRGFFADLFKKRSITLNDKQAKSAAAYASAMWTRASLLGSVDVEDSKLYIGEPFYPEHSVTAMRGTWLARFLPCTESLLFAHPDVCNKLQRGVEWRTLKVVGGHSMQGIWDREHDAKEIQAALKDMKLDGPYSLECARLPHLIAVQAGEMRGRIVLIGYRDDKACAVVFPSLVNNRVVDDNWPRKYKKISRCTLGKF